MIVAGKKSEVVWEDGKWIFLDIGFASTSRTCGFAFDDEDPTCLSFGGARTQVIKTIRKCGDHANLVIEAPLSVCFDAYGNPRGRKIERHGTQTRYWYVGLGCAVMTAALYLIRDIHRAGLQTELRIFEGFVSFKEPGRKSNHKEDIRQLRETIKNSPEHQGSIFAPDDLRIDANYTLQNAFGVAEMDFGIPAVIAAKGKA